MSRLKALVQKRAPSVPARREAQKEAIQIEQGPVADLPETGSVRFARANQAMRKLAAQGFEDSSTSEELVSLSGRFARVESLSQDTEGPVRVHIRRAYSRP